MPSVIITIIRNHGRLEAVISFPTLPGYVRQDDPILQVEQNIDFTSSKPLDDLIAKVRDQANAKGFKEIVGLGA